MNRKEDKAEEFRYFLKPHKQKNETVQASSSWDLLVKAHIEKKINILYSFIILLINSDT